MGTVQTEVEDMGYDTTKIRESGNGDHHTTQVKTAAKLEITVCYKDAKVKIADSRENTSFVIKMTDDTNRGIINIETNVSSSPSDQLEDENSKKLLCHGALSDEEQSKDANTEFPPNMTAVEAEPYIRKWARECESINISPAFLNALTEVIVGNTNNITPAALQWILLGWELRGDDEEKENNESGKVSLRSNSKALPGVAEENENNKNSKGKDTAQKNLSKKTLRQLREMLKQGMVSDDETTTGNNKKTVVKEQLEKK